MEYTQFRDILRTHFAKMLEGQKRDIRENGHLTPVVVQSFESHVQEANRPTNVSIRVHEQLAAVDRFSVNQLLEAHSLPTDLSSDVRHTLLNEYRRADVAYAQAVLDYDRTWDSYEFGGSAEAVQQPLSTPTIAADMSLEELVSQQWKYAAIEKIWIAKTRGEKQEHIDLLYEVLGKTASVKSIGRTEAHRMRDILVAYPVNRNKLTHTRGKTLDELSAMTDLRTLHPLTINKYLQTYNGLFSWAKRNGYCATNPFDGLAVRTDKANSAAPRLPFSITELEALRIALLDPSSGIQDHHKWGTLLAMHSGARLNEVAQLHLEDIADCAEIPLFSINPDGPTKKLKNTASKRMVPIHPRLIEYGLLDYVQTMRNKPGSNRLFPQLSYTQSDGYGRNLGRWFNETFLPALGIKTRQLTFHSLRHTVVERLRAAEVSEPHIMAIVGHEPGTTTLKTYNRQGFPPKQLLSALEKIL